MTKFKLLLHCAAFNFLLSACGSQHSNTSSSHLNSSQSKLCFRSEADFNPNASFTEMRDNAYWMAVASKLTYLDDQSRDSILERKFGKSYIYSFEEKGLTFDTQGYAARLESEKGNSTLIVFRGSHEMTDYVTDINLIPVPFYGIDENGRQDPKKFLGYVHKGFLTSLDSVWNQLYKVVQNTQDPIFLTGHSMGGAIATLASARLMSAKNRFNVRGVFTFGSPRVGGTDFFDTMARLSTYESRIFRFVNADDAISVMPSVPMLPYVPTWWHVGELQWFDATGRLYSNSAAYERATTTIWTKRISTDWVYDHIMAGYLKKLEKLIYPKMAECQGI